jgi:hypothetical protein
MVNNSTNINKRSGYSIVDIGGIVDHHCLEGVIRLLILVVLLTITV